uniref:F-BAR domain-containing protein n=1 Tax=Monopterus albus TaxID=43700 RepID=A0A3Q3K711_MONAL
MMMEASFDTEESFDDPSCFAPQPPGSVSPAKRQIKEVKETKITINCVTFPLPGEGPEQQLLKPNEWSYCDYFWTDKKDPQGTTSVAGFEVLLQKQLKGKQMQKEMAEFIHERIKIEEEYAKNLSKLSLSPLAAQEEGTLGEAWTQMKKSLHDEAEVHLKFSNKLHSEVEKPLLTFRGDNFKKDLKKYDHHIADLRKQLASRYASVEKVLSPQILMRFLRYQPVYLQYKMTLFTYWQMLPSKCVQISKSEPPVLIMKSNPVTPTLRTSWYGTVLSRCFTPVKSE